MAPLPHGGGVPASFPALRGYLQRVALLGEPSLQRTFLHGGDGTIRGYTQGEATPVDPAGQPTGAEFYLLANIELEQRILQNLSVVAFWDGLAQSGDIEKIPDKVKLHSIGTGLRLRSPVGPIRLEYGPTSTRARLIRTAPSILRWDIRFRHCGIATG
ncbi:MAG: BamA/TamA family outer membrane protein [Oceanipulchritudo sp.]